MIQKHKPIRLKKIRDSARGQDCTVESPWCNHNPETVVFAHYSAPDESGMGMKPDDTSGAYACSDCHDWLDGRVNHAACIPEEYYWFRACRRTWRLLIEREILK